MRRAVAAGAGVLLSFAFAPRGWWPLAVLSPAILFWLWQGASRRDAAWLGFWFNAGTFSVGTYWLYTSIHGFGQAPVWLALMLMAGLVAIMGTYHAALGYSAARWLPARGPLRWLVGLPAAWLLTEWFRGWFLSGFSWLSLGYSQTDTLLARYAPVLGVYGISALLLMSAGALVMLGFARTARPRVIAAAVLALPWIVAMALDVQWTRAAGRATGVAVIQGAIPQDMKWLEANRDATLERYAKLTREALGTPLIVWPESAVPDLANNVGSYLGSLYREAGRSGSALAIGVVRASDAGDQVFNSVLVMGERGVGWYDKRHLVPFAEYFPVPGFVRNWLRLMSLPYSDFTHGSRSQPPLIAAALRLLPTICYEDAYGTSQLAQMADANVLVNVTNDAWFGRSSARYQHLQIARMRAIEAGRYIVRAANDGVSAVIGPRGEIVARAPEHEPAVLRAEIVPHTGLAPYAHFGNWPILLLAVAAVTLAAAQRFRLGARAAA